MTGAQSDYVLGTRDEEIERLGLQHRVWRPRVLDAWMRAGLSVGRTVLDVGCGPGYASVDLAEIVGPAGRVIAVDKSSRFLDVLNRQAAARGLAQITTRAIDLDGLGPDDLGPPESVDFAWCRWVAAFVRDPRALVAAIARVLRPGGVVVFHEYLEYEAWRMLPASPSFTAFVTSVIGAWRASGGEPNVGADLPGWLEANGFTVTSTTPIQDVVLPADFGWQWPRAFVRVGLDRLTQLGVVPAAQATEMWRDFLAREADGHTRMANPIVLEIIASSRR